MNKRPQLTVSRKLALLASLAQHMGRMPESARALVTMPHVDLRPKEKPKFIAPKDRAPNTQGLNRRSRRRLMHMASHGKTLNPVPRPPAPKLLSSRDDGL